MNKTRRKASIAIKSLTVAFAFLGVSLSLVFAARDGYSSAGVRLLYFTGLSNLWIAAMLLAMLIIPCFKAFKENTRVKNSLYILRYIFTVSITLTGFIFCAVLAPGAKNTDYNAWTFSNVITHAVVPALAIFDMFFDPYRVLLTKKHVHHSLLPPFFYLIFASILILLKVDFGRGDPYPYVFLNYYSPAGFFGFSDVPPYIFGSFYWIVLMLFGVIGIGFLYRKLYNKRFH